MSVNQKSLYLVEDDTGLGDALASHFQSTPDFTVLGVCVSGEELLELLKSAEPEPDIILVDLGLPGMSGQEVIAEVNNIFPAVDCIAHTVFEDRRTVLEALKAGASGYLLKGSTGEELSNSLKTLETGGTPLTPKIARLLVTEFQEQAANPLTTREREVLESLGQGFSYKECAEQLTVSVHTVHSHVKSIYGKLKVSSKRQAVDKAQRKGWL